MRVCTGFYATYAAGVARHGSRDGRFLASDGVRRGWEHQPTGAVGTTVVLPGPAIVGRTGFHGYCDPVDALYAADGPVLQVFELGGSVARRGDVAAGTTRHTIWEGSVWTTLQRFVGEAVEHTFHTVPPKPDEEAALDVLRQWAAGQVAPDTWKAAWWPTNPTLRASLQWALAAQGVPAVGRAAWLAVTEVAHAATGANGVPRLAAGDAERAWQAARLRDLLCATGVPL